MPPSRKIAYRWRVQPIQTTLLLVLLFCLLGAMTGCSPQNVTPESVEAWVRHSEWSESVYLSKWPDVTTRGLGVGFVLPEFREVHPYQRPQNAEFHIRQGESFATLLILSTGYSMPYPVLISVFLDYQQVRFTLDGQQGLLHYLEIEPGVDMEIPIEVSIPTIGRHDLVVVMFPEPDHHPTDLDERLPSSGRSGGKRAMVCVEDCTLASASLPIALVGTETSSVKGLPNAFLLSPDPDRPPGQRLFMSTTVSSGEVIPLELWAGNAGDSAKEYVVLPVLDYRQIAFAGSRVLHLNMPPGSELFLTGEIKAPDEAGVHELQLIYLFDPYRLPDEISDPFVMSLMHSAIVVEGIE